MNRSAIIHRHAARRLRRKIDAEKGASLEDLSGYVASFLVFMAFYMKAMVPLRVMALLSNVAFLVYGFQLRLAPIILLHGALLLVNFCRLLTIWRAAEPQGRFEAEDASRIRAAPVDPEGHPQGRAGAFTRAA